MRYFYLDPLAGSAPVTDVPRVDSSEAPNAAFSGRKVRILQLCEDKPAQPVVQAADRHNILFAFAAMDCDYDMCSCDYRRSHGLVKISARDVQFKVASVTRALKAIERVLTSRDFVGDF
jgi:hypothetical protein